MTAPVLLKFSGCFWEGEMDFDVFESKFGLAPFSHSFWFLVVVCWSGPFFRFWFVGFSFSCF